MVTAVWISGVSRETPAEGTDTIQALCMAGRMRPCERDGCGYSVAAQHPALPLIIVALRWGIQVKGGSVGRMIWPLRLKYWGSTESPTGRVCAQSAGGWGCCVGQAVNRSQIGRRKTGTRGDAPVSDVRPQWAANGIPD